MTYLPPANEVWGKVIFSVACVKNFVHGGVCLSAYWDTTTTPTTPTAMDQALPGADTPWDQAHSPGTRYPPAQCMLGDTVNKRTVCILLECNLVSV